MTMVSAVVNGRGAKMREPNFMAGIYYAPVKNEAAVEFKYLLIAFLVLILVSLGKALFHLSSSRPEDSGKMVKALAWRVGLSVFLFVLLIVAYSLGWVQPQHMR
jgi:hypothetical protein